MATTNISDAGDEVTAGDTVDTAVFLVPGNWMATNTGSQNCVINLDAAAAPTRTQPVGVSGRFLPPGATVFLGAQTRSVTYQDAVDGSSSKILFSKG